LLFDAVLFNPVELHCHIVRFVFTNEDVFLRTYVWSECNLAFWST